EELNAAIGFGNSNGLPIFILGGGSNLLVSDNGFPGLVIKIGITGIAFEDREDGTVRVTAAAGEDWDPFVETVIGRGLSGLECLSGIPGLVGATPIQNVGAYGQEVSGSIAEVRCLDRETGERLALTNAECGFAYRSSIFNTTQRGRFVVLAVSYDLRPGGVPHLEYRDLADRFDGRVPTLAETRAAVLEIRRQKSMVIDPRDPNSRSAGSFFKNPIVEQRAADLLSEALGESVPSFQSAGGMAKIPAAWLIEKAGFSKGYTLGNAGLSANHSLAIINRGDARADDIIALKELIRSAVFEKFGIELVPEPVFLGFPD
ncbi:MAG TPA: UDP-N-acetylmuramate dehydrogenase, partial [Pyrinomonadaceae bacterium]|nr:UDP-N-acetylmuramate dehydrogenase [Pyrinomonadaceae bacterium]